MSGAGAQTVEARAARIELAVFDVDGVMTDGSLYLSDSGEEMKAFHVRDGQGMKMLQAGGVRLGIITGRQSRLVDMRATSLGVGHLFQAVDDKLSTWNGLLAELGLQPEQCAYMGDDIVDLPVLRRCGLAVTVPEAPEIVRQNAHLVTRSGGGRGAVRELCEMILRSKGLFDAQLTAYLA